MHEDASRKGDQDVKYRMRLTAAAFGLALVGALAVACGSNSGTAGTAGTGNPGDNGGGSAFQAYLSCLSRNGVTIQVPSRAPGAGRSGGPGGGFPGPGGSGPPGGFPSGGPGGGGFPGGGGIFQKPAGVDDATWQKAQTACASLRPSFGPGGRRDNGALRAYQNCLSNHGVSASARPNELNTADPTVAAAEKACAALRPTTAPSAGG